MAVQVNKKKMQIEFTGEELKELGFQATLDDTEAYYQYVLDPSDYLNSKFLATESMHDLTFLLDFGNKPKFKVHSPYNTEGEEWLTKEQITDIISKGDF